MPSIVAGLFIVVAVAAKQSAPIQPYIDELRAAVKADDLPRFDEALEHARTAIEIMPVGKERNLFRRAIQIAADIGQIWHFAASDPEGSYYDDERLPEFYDHMKRDYPAYADFIAEHAVMDHDGRVLYPTRETRAFLLNQLENTRRTSA